MISYPQIYPLIRTKIKNLKIFRKILKLLNFDKIKQNFHIIIIIININNLYYIINISYKYKLRMFNYSLYQKHMDIKDKYDKEKSYFIDNQSKHKSKYSFLLDINHILIKKATQNQLEIIKKGQRTL